MRSYMDAAAVSVMRNELIALREAVDLCETRLLEAGVAKSDLPTMVWKLVCENERLQRIIDGEDAQPSSPPPTRSGEEEQDSD